VHCRPTKVLRLLLVDGCQNNQHVCWLVIGLHETSILHQQSSQRTRVRNPRKHRAQTCGKVMACNALGVLKFLNTATSSRFSIHNICAAYGLQAGTWVGKIFGASGLPLTTSFVCSHSSSMAAAPAPEAAWERNCSIRRIAEFVSAVFAAAGRSSNREGGRKIER